MNIHRHPLCGRNFEYLSEDPLLSGRMAYAMCAGMANAGTSGTIKHLCANNQETNRHNLDSVVSQRALREIYLKPFEIAVRMGDACKAVMTSYNPVNGTWTSGHYDLTTTILREDWGYTGFVMSDWWCRTKLEEFDRYHGKINQGERDYIPCVEAQNDIYMCCKNSADFKNLNVYDSLVSGRVARGFAQRNAMNVCRFLMHSTAMERYLAMSEESMKAMLGAFEKGELLLESRESEAVFLCRQAGTYILCADIASTGSQLSQNTAIFYANGEYVTSFTVAGSNGTVTENAKRITLTEGENRITVKYPKDALSIAKLSIYAEKG
jgi:beta-glucosidase